MHPTLQKWHDFVQHRDPVLLDQILADEAHFHSPVVHTPQRGKKIVAAYLSAALGLLATPGVEHSFKYVNKVIDERHFFLEFECLLDGIHVNGIDMIEINEEGKIIKFKVMVRPLKAIHMVHQKMGEALASMK